MIEKKGRILEFSFYAACLLSAAFFVSMRGQDRNWDLLNYHFYQGYSLLSGRFLVDIAPAGLQSFLNPIVNILPYFAFTYLPFPFSACFILLPQLASIPAIVLLTKEIGVQLGYSRSFIPVLPVILLSLQAPLWGSELGTSFSSSSTAPLVLWGVYFVMRSYKMSYLSISYIVKAGFLFGLAAGLKLTNAPFAVTGLLMMVILLYKSYWRTMVMGVTYFGTALVVGFACTAWWNWHLWVTWESPIFPFYNAIFKSEFFNFVNFRDMRWHFTSFQDFLKFIVESAWGTDKTSEAPFADSRFLFFILLLPSAILCKPAIRLNRGLIAFIVFMITSFALWALMFAYQRYLIPIELLLGLLIWIIVARVVENDALRNKIMIGLAICAAMLMHIPNWGHSPAALGDNNPFSIELSSKLLATPARYVVVGAPISYVLPFFHQDSLFYGIGLSTQVDDLVYKNLAKVSDLPLRILAKDDDAHLIKPRLKRTGYDQAEHFLECNYFRTGIGRYIICEVQFQTRQLEESHTAIHADFSSNGYLNSSGILWDRGMSFYEPWGRWSDGDQVQFGLSNCLPQGHLNLAMLGHASGPNVGLPIKVAIGDKEIIIKFADATSQQTAHFSNEAKCVDKIIITIPKPKSHLELGISADTRKVGIALVSLKVIKE